MSDDLKFVLTGAMLFAAPSIDDGYLRAIGAGVVMIGVSVMARKKWRKK